MAREQLYDNICRKQSFLCVGLDTDLKKVPQHLIERAAKEEGFDPIFEFNKAIIDATAPYCIAYKPNLAFYEAHGVKGWIAFEQTSSSSLTPSAVILATQASFTRVPFLKRWTLTP